MKILVVTPRYDERSGGDGLYAYALSRSLQENEVCADVLTLRNQHFVLVCRDYERALAKVPTNLFAENFFSVAAKRSAETVLRENSYDLVHIHGIHQHFTVSTLQELRRKPVPLVMTVHDYKIVCGNAGLFSDRTNDLCLKCLGGRFLPPLSERCKRNSFVESAGISAQMALWKVLNGLQAIDCFHCGSTFVADILQQHPIVSRKVRKVRFPFLSTAETKTVANLVVNEPNVAFIGRMVPHKGIIEFADAVKDIQVKIDVFGDGRLMPEAREILKGNSHVQFHGWTSHSEMDNSLGLGSIVVVPYLAHETFCFVVLEAMLRGCCVIASRRGAIPELIEHEVNGVLVDEPTSDNFRSAVTALLGNREKVLSLGKKALAVRNTLNNMETHALEMVELYKSVIAMKKGEIHA